MVEYVMNVREILDKTGLTRVDLAKKLGITNMAIQRWIERGIIPKKHEKYIKTITKECDLKTIETSKLILELINRGYKISK
jgi:ribosome-binding protein aMBF1 (putative translation factor)